MTDHANQEADFECQLQQASPEEAESKKSQFKRQLKLYIRREHGQFIFDSLYLASNGSFKERAVQQEVCLSLDFLQMVYSDSFLGENFFRCFFRYYPLLSEYVKQIFVQLLREEEGEVAAQKAFENLAVKVHLKLMNFPFAEERLEAHELLRSPYMRTHGQLVALKLARVVSVCQPSLYVESKTFKQLCTCVHSPPYVHKANCNPIKIFRNSTSEFNACMKTQYYKNLVSDELEEVCRYCDQKYLEVKKLMAQCQIVEILPLSCQKRGLTSLKDSVYTLWLMEPFVNQL